MIDIVTSLLLSKNLEFEEGEIKLLGQNVSLLPCEVYVNLFKVLSQSGKEDIFYQSGKDAAFSWFSNFIEVANKRDTNDLLTFLPKFLNVLAYGKVSFVKSDVKNLKFEISLENPLFPSHYGVSTKPVDLIFSGILAGAIKAIYKKEVNSKETKCVAQGFDRCYFTVSKGSNV